MINILRAEYSQAAWVLNPTYCNTVTTGFHHTGRYVVDVLQVRERPSLLEWGRSC